MITFKFLALNYYTTEVLFFPIPDDTVVAGFTVGWATF